jgi:hypothetical protein
MKSKLAKRSLAVGGLLTAGLISSLVVPAAATDVQVSVFSFPGLNGGANSCSNENFNLAEIVEAEVGYTVDTTITNFTDSDLRAKLDASRFFFMTDMESQDPLLTGFLPASAKLDIEGWTDAGGVMVMTGTSGAKDSDFLNTIYGWDVASVSPNLLTPVLANTSGTPFEDFSGNLTTPSATDAMNMGTVANVTVMWGDSDGSAALVSVVEYGRGYVIYLGFDFFSTGLTGDSGSPCTQNSTDWVQEIVPAALQYATTLADENAAPVAPAPYTGPLLQGFSITALDPCVATTVSISGQRLSGVTSASIQDKEVAVVDSSASSMTLQFPAGLTPGNNVDLVINSSYGTLTHQDAFDIPARTCVDDSSTGTWTKNLGSGEVKMYAKNIVGAGKVQFMLNGEEIAWVRATSAADSKLRTANGASYLVRTVDLVEGQKNVLEIYVDGVRAWRAAYSY